MFALEDSISERAVRAMVSKDQPRGTGTPDPAPPRTTPRASALLRGRYHAAKYTPEGARKGYECFQQPWRWTETYALAYVGLAYYYFVSCNEFSLPPGEPCRKPRRRRRGAPARRLSGRAQLYLLRSFLVPLKWAAAESEFERAIRLNAQFDGPSPLRPRTDVDWTVRSGHRGSRIGAGDRSPRWRRSLIWASALFFPPYDAAIEKLEQAIEIDPSYWFAHFNSGGRTRRPAGCRKPSSVGDGMAHRGCLSRGPDRVAALTHSQEKRRRRASGEEVTATITTKLRAGLSHRQGFAGLGRTEERSHGSRRPSQRDRRSCRAPTRSGARPPSLGRAVPDLVRRVGPADDDAGMIGEVSTGLLLVILPFTGTPVAIGALERPRCPPPVTMPRCGQRNRSAGKRSRRGHQSRPGARRQPAAACGSHRCAA